MIKIDELKEKVKEQSKSDTKLPLTPKQIEGIYAEGDNILISASAGSGKTFVMVERIIQKLLSGQTLSRLFISTFTVKAADELRERLSKRLKEEINKGDQRIKSHLLMQLEAINVASIGTMDSFNRTFLAEYGYLKGLLRNYRVLEDDNEKKELKNQIYTDLFEDYSQEENFSQMVYSFVNSGKTDQKFREMIFDIIDFTQSLPYPRKWLKEDFLKGYALYNDENSFPILSFDDLCQELYFIARRSQEVLDHGEIKETSATYQKLQKMIVAVPKLITLIQKRQLVRFSQALKDLVDQKVLKKEANGFSRVSQIKDEFLLLSHAYQRFLHLDQVVAYQRDSLPQIKLLQEFAIAFYDRYLQEKLSENVLEFGDLSHLVITILSDNDQICYEVSERYDEIMIDEYQDTNEIQETILKLLSNGHNRFMVGDIKQSIYGFRQANPQLFLDKLNEYQDSDHYTHQSSGLLISLQENFRSQKEVIDATNHIFGHLMDERIGGIVYDRKQSLIAGSSHQTKPNPKRKTKLVIAQSKEEQIKWVAKEIKALHEEKGISFKDIAILYRSGDITTDIQYYFDQLRIPINLSKPQMNYLESIEIKVMLALLRLLDNPLNDIALASVLRSPMFSFNEDELMRIRLQSSKESKERRLFYDDLKLSLSKEGQHPELIDGYLYDKLTQFIRVYQKWREYGRSHSIAELIWEIYRDKYYYDYVGGLANGEQRQINLYSLASRANRYEKTGYKGLTRFVKVIDDFVKNDKDLEMVPLSQKQDAVSVMTIHKSKGLEFNYVFMINLDKKVNLRDLSDKFAIFDKRNGVGLKQVVDLKTKGLETRYAYARASFETLPYQLFQQQLKVDQIAEEMRLLYVGMTRAEKQLYLVTSDKKGKKGIPEDLSLKKQDKVLPIEDRMSEKGHGYWLDIIYNTYDDVKEVIDYVTIEEDSLGNIEPIIEPKGNSLEKTLSVKSESAIEKAKMILDSSEEVNRRFYDAIHLPSRQSPSQVKKRYLPLVGEHLTNRMQAEERKTLFDLPKFSSAARQEKNKEASELGTATHALLQEISIDKKVSLQSLQETLQQIDIDVNLKKAINLQKIVQFFETDLGKQITKYHDAVVREQSFDMLKKDEKSGETFLLRGVIDGFLKMDNHFILWDYKTNYFTSESDIKRIKDKYQDQMELYADALKKAYHIDNVDKYLVLLGGKGLPVKIIKY